MHAKLTGFIKRQTEPQSLNQWPLQAKFQLSAVRWEEFTGSSWWVMHGAHTQLFSLLTVSSQTTKALFVFEMGFG